MYSPIDKYINYQKHKLAFEGAKVASEEVFCDTRPSTYVLKGDFKFC